MLATNEDSPLKKQTTSESLEFNNLVQEVEREISADRKQVERALPVVLETVEMEEAVADDEEEVAGGETSRVSATTDASNAVSQRIPLPPVTSLTSSKRERDVTSEELLFGTSSRQTRG